MAGAAESKNASDGSYKNCFVYGENVILAGR